MNRYQNNAFRVLGLPSNASVQEVLARANEIKVKSSVGISVKFDYDFPWIGPIDRSEENLNNAVQRIENPVSRFQEELAWFWVESDRDKEAISLLVKGDHGGANTFWKTENPTAWHNRLVLIHSIVIATEASIIYENLGKCNVCSACGHQFLDTDNYVFCLKCGGKVITVPKEVKKLSEAHWGNWDFVINRLNALKGSPEYWGEVRKKVQLINDPRLSDNNIEEFRSKFLSNNLSVNFQVIKRALEVKDYERVKQHVLLVNKVNLPVEVLRDGLNSILRSRIDFINEKINKYEKYLTDLAKTTPKELILLSNQLISEISESLYDCNLIDTKLLSEVSLAKDNLAKIVKRISIKLNRDFDDNEHALYLINMAIEYSVSDFIKQDLEENKKVLQENLKFEQNLNYEDKFGSEVISIDKEHIKCGNKSFNTRDITAIRYGVFISTTNGFTSRYYTFWLTDGQSTLHIECNQGFLLSEKVMEERFRNVRQRLYPLIQYPQINNMIEDFKNGKDVLVGDLTFNKKGIYKDFVFDPISRAGTNFFSKITGGETAEQKEAKERFLAWEEYSGWGTHQGKINIGKKIKEKAEVWHSLSLRDIWNAVNIDPFLEYLNKDNRLWLIIKEQNNGNS